MTMLSEIDDQFISLITDHILHCRSLQPRSVVPISISRSLGSFGYLVVQRSKMDRVHVPESRSTQRTLIAFSRCRFFPLRINLIRVSNTASDRLKLYKWNHSLIARRSKLEPVSHLLKLGARVTCLALQSILGQPLSTSVD